MRMTEMAAELEPVTDSSTKRERIYAPTGWLAIGTTEDAEDRPVKPTSPEFRKIINAVAAVHGLEKTLLSRVRQTKTSHIKPTFH